MNICSNKREADNLHFGVLSDQFDKLRMAASTAVNGRKSRITVKGAIATVALLLTTAAANAADYDQRIDDLADSIEQKVIAWRHDIHQHPELGNREFRTSKLIADHLRKLDFDVVKDRIAPTGVVGILRGGKPGDGVVALRADFDALPVKETADVPFASTVVDDKYPGGPFPVAHACGHDTHAAMLMGAAEVLAKMRSEIPGTVMVIFQPAEEGPPLGEPFGAQAMLDAGIFRETKPDAVFGIHSTFYPLNTVGVAVGVQNGASEVFTIEINGKQTHGSMPFLGLDPMPVLAAINDGLAQIYRQIDTNDQLTISVGKIDTVGRTNIVGEKITAYGTVRTAKDSVMEDVNDRFQRIVEHAAEMHGLTASVKFEQHVPAIVHSHEWVDRMKPTAARVLGSENLWLAKPTMGYDDISVFMNAAGGGIYYLLGGQHTKFDDEGNLVAAEEGGPGPIPNHNPAYYVDDAMLKTGVRLLTYSALDSLNGS